MRTSPPSPMVVEKVTTASECAYHLCMGRARQNRATQTLSALRTAVPAHKRAPMSSKDVLELFGDGWEAREHNPTGLRLSTGILHGGPYAYMETFKGFGGPRLTVSEAT
jgi:hypothetical protein